MELNCIFEDAQYSAADGTQLGTCKMIESVTQDAMTLRAFLMKRVQL